VYDDLKGESHAPLPPAAWPVAFGAIALLSAVLGFIGLREYLADRTDYGRSFLDILYYDLQLFIINCPPVSNGGPYPIPLEIARFGAPAATAYALAATLWLLLDRQRQQLRVRMARGHAIVCASGQMGLQLGLRLRADGREAVLVSRDPSAPEAARSLGLLHVAGDPRDEAVLRRAGAANASEVFVLSPDSAACAATVLAAARLAHGRRRLSCYASIADREVHAGLLARQLGHSSEHALHLHLVNVDELAGQALVAGEPAYEAARPPRVVVLGSGGLGQALTLELARRHRARFRISGRQLGLTLVGAGAEAALRRLAAQAPFLTQVCDIRAHDIDVGAVDEGWLARVREDGPPPDRVYVCSEDDTAALRVGLRVLRLRHHHAVQVVVCVQRGASLSHAFHGDEVLFDDVEGSLRVVALLELICSPQLIRSSPVTEQLARALHDSYLASAAVQNGVAGERSSLRPWEELPADLQEANRAQARHVGVKLAAIGCALVPHFDPHLAFAYRDGEVTALARMEHERWLRERREQGFVHGPRREGRRHPDLVPWEELSTESQEKDRQFVLALPGLLAEAGFQVLRLRQAGGSPRPVSRPPGGPASPRPVTPTG